MSLLIAAYSLRLRTLAETAYQSCVPIIEGAKVSSAPAVVAGALSAVLLSAASEGAEFGSAWVRIQGGTPKSPGSPLPAAERGKILGLASAAVAGAVAVYQLRLSALRLRSALEAAPEIRSEVQEGRALAEFMTAVKTEIQSAIDAAGQVGIREVTP